MKIGEKSPGGLFKDNKDARLKVDHFRRFPKGVALLLAGNPDLSDKSLNYCPILQIRIGE